MRGAKRVGPNQLIEVEVTKPRRRSPGQPRQPHERRYLRDLVILTLRRQGFDARAIADALSCPIGRSQVFRRLLVLDKYLERKARSAS